ncbi:MAG: twin-arginine translocase subunit TatB [Hyphomicrobiales bacterium]|nr:twin-arginine translocase subunit TatB [Hyphomicrobiales bacterium]
MFDIAWSEMVVIGAVALIAIGPKDLPKALRAVGAMTAKARRMAAEFQDHFREAMREAELESVKQEVANIHQDLSSATSGLQNDFNSIGSQLPSSPEPASEQTPKLGEPASPVSAEPFASGNAGSNAGEASSTGTTPTVSPTQPGEPGAKLSVEATPTAVIVTETASPIPDGAVEVPAPQKPVRKKRAASKTKAKSDAPAQASLLASEPDAAAEPREKPHKRAAKAGPPGDDRVA